MKHILACQKTAGLSPKASQVHTDDDLAFKLQNRETATRVFTDCFKERKANLSMAAMPDDRTKYPMPVFSGMKGLGKTRMLGEWEDAFKEAGILPPYAGLIVTYGNGHGVVAQDTDLPITASFCWRMLHRLFIDSNSKDSTSQQWTSGGFLPCNAAALTLPVTLEVVRALLQEAGVVTEGAMLSLFIGIDEYQAIPVGATYEQLARQINRDHDDAAVLLKDLRKRSHMW
jgi:hypothetical protein